MVLDRHNIPRVLEDLRKDSKTSLRGVEPPAGHGRPPEGPSEPGALCQGRWPIGLLEAA
jgi:hypothetical protein